jgi:glycosyltransferase involved in cell wall biosynthesis
MAELKKILFVVDTLAQHGAERYLYEILKAIDRSKFECSVLCTYPLTDSNNYYAPLISDLGIKINTFEFGELYPSVTSTWKRKLLNSITYRWLNLTGKKKELKERAESELHKKLEGFELISILKIEVFNRFPQVFARYPNIVIHLLSWGIQYLKNPYENLPDRPYRFVTMIESQKEHVLETQFKTITNPKFDFFGFPLILDLNGRENNYVASTENPIIGVFSRINYDQPTIMFLFAFQLLLKRIPTAKMHFYGKAISDEHLQFYHQTAEILGISHALTFKGHVPDLQRAISDDQITMGWMNIGNSTLGYSSIEIASFGLPVTFFNIDKHDPLKIDARLNVFNDLEAFVEHSAAVLFETNKLKLESQKTHEFIQSKHSSSLNINELEMYLIESMRS